MKRHTRQTKKGCNSRNCRGIALAWTAIVLVVMIGMVGLSIDWGKAVWNVHQMQNAADAAALAGAQVVKFDPTAAIPRAYDIGLENHVDGLAVTLSKTDGVDITVGRWIRQHREFLATTDTPDAVRVRVRRGDKLGSDRPPLAMLFAPLFGTNPVNASREAVAWDCTYSGAALICLSTTAQPALKIWGNAEVDVSNGGIHVNSSATPAVQVGGSAEIECGFLNSVGETQPGADAAAWDSYFKSLPFSVNTQDTSGVTAIDDPVAAAMGGNNELDLPRDAGGNLIYGTVKTGTTITKAGAATINSSCTLGPGYFPGGITMKGGKTIVLDPTLGWDSSTMGQPVFFLGGVGLIANNGSLTGHGVTIYITDAKSAKLDLGGNITIDLTSPGDEAGTSVDGMAGISIWVDPDNTNDVTLNGCVGEGVAGTLYFPGSHVDIEGTPGDGCTQLIAASMDVTGNVNIGVDYDKRNFGNNMAVSYIVR